MRFIQQSLYSGLKILAVALIAVTLGGCDEAGTPSLTYDEAVGKLAGLKANVDWSNDPVNGTAIVPLRPEADIKKTLPDIGEFPLTVDPVVTRGDVVVEIFVTTIRGWGSVVGGRERPADGLVSEIARAFNQSDQRLIGGKRARVRVRYIASGTAYQVIASGKYMPDAYSPVHHLWIRMLEANGVPVTRIRESMAMSAGGVVVRNADAERLRSIHGDLDVKAIIDEVVQGNMAMGYSNPFASSTGLNFLVTVLSTFAGGDETAMLSPAVEDTFRKFQQNVPFIALTTVEMRESVLREGGSLDAFVMGYQSYISTRQLQTGFEFIPFGVAHDQPLHAVGNPGPAKLEALELFARFAERPEYRKLAGEYGWNRPLANDFTPTVAIPSGDTLIQVQKFWKDKKDAGRPVAAVFVGDVSGSMAGTRLNGVKQALISGSEFIGTENRIGLVTFSDDVRVVLPLGEFDLKQRSRFVAAVQDMNTGGGTAMYNGIVVALSMLVEEQQNNPDIKPMLIVLSDGDTNRGYEFRHLDDVIAGLGIPVHTVGYEADLAELKKLAGLVEATAMKAGEDNVLYKLVNLFTVKM